jgi:HK97 family phage major capsid protein
LRQTAPVDEQAVARAADVSRGMPDQRLFAGPTGLGETVPSDGGYVVGIDQGVTILQRVYDTGNILSRVKRIPISTGANGIKLPAIDETSRADGSRFGGVQGYWMEEAGTITATKPTIRQNSLTLHKVAGIVYVTDELLQDAAALEAWIMEYLPQELVFKIEDAIVNGDGVGKPLGWRTSNAVVSVAKNTGQAAATFDYTNNAQGGRTPNTPAPYVLVASGTNQAQSILLTGTITQVNVLTIPVSPATEFNFSNP